MPEPKYEPPVCPHGFLARDLCITCEREDAPEPIEDVASREIRFGPYEMAFRVEQDTVGHIHVGVFIGKTGQTRGKAGVLVFNREEWQAFDAERGPLQEADATEVRNG